MASAHNGGKWIKVGGVFFLLVCLSLECRQTVDNFLDHSMSNIGSGIISDWEPIASLVTSLSNQVMPDLLLSVAEKGGA